MTPSSSAAIVWVTPYAHPNYPPIATSSLVMSTMTPTQLAAWIEDLRGRRDRGEFHRHSELESYIWYLLQQVDGWRAATPGERAEPGAQQANPAAEGGPASTPCAPRAEPDGAARATGVATVAGLPRTGCAATTGALPD